MSLNINEGSIGEQIYFRYILYSEDIKYLFEH